MENDKHYSYNIQEHLSYLDRHLSLTKCYCGGNITKTSHSERHDFSASYGTITWTCNDCRSVIKKMDYDNGGYND